MAVTWPRGSARTSSYRTSSHCAAGMAAWAAWKASMSSFHPIPARRTNEPSAASHSVA